MTNESRRRLVMKVIAGATAFVVLAACSGTVTTADAVGSSAGTGTSNAAAAATTLFDSSVVHSISVEYNETDYQAMIATFTSSGDKEWITATVIVDGTVFTNVGIKLKGNSTLKGLGTTDSGAQQGAPGGGLGGDVSVDEPEGLPWRIRLDKFVDGQNYQGETDFVVRGGNTETGLNEAVALELIGAAGLATEEATAARFSVNGSPQTLRLVIQNPSEDWDSATFDSAGILYKAEAGGDYSYRGDDAASYTAVFEVEAVTSEETSGEDDYTPLIAFLKFINESDDATFAAELGSHLDVAAFAKYLAIQDLVANSDDIDGPGNNSYLRYDATTDSFTVVAWDQNLSFSSMGGGGGQRPVGGNGGMQAPAEGAAAADGAAPGGGPGNRPGAGGMSGSNILSERFLANAEFKAMYDQAVTDLTAQLYTSGTGQQILDTWKGVLSTQASDLVSTETIDSEAAAISKYLTAT